MVEVEVDVDVKAKGGSLDDVTMSQRKAGQWNDAEVADADPGDPAACVPRLGESGFGFALADADAGLGRLTTAVLVTAVQFADADGFVGDSENHAVCAGFVAGDAEFGHHAHGFAADPEHHGEGAGSVAGDSESGFAVLHVDTGHSGDDPLGIQGFAGQFVFPSAVSAIQHLEGILFHPGGVSGCVVHENYTCPDDRVGLALNGDRPCLLVLLHCLPLEVSSTPKPVLKRTALGSKSH